VFVTWYIKWWKQGDGNILLFGYIKKSWIQLNIKWKYILTYSVKNNYSTFNDVYLFYCSIISLIYLFMNCNQMIP